MHKSYTVLKWSSLIIASVILANCGGGGSSSSTDALNDTPTSVINGSDDNDAVIKDTSTSANHGVSTKNDTIDTSNNTNTKEDEFSRSTHQGLNFYYKNISSSEYKLTQLTDASYNTLNETQKSQVANKLLSTLFFGYPLKVLQEKIASGNFIQSIQNDLATDKTDKEWLETHILDAEQFEQSRNNQQPAVDILARFHAMRHLDKYFLDNWTAYILTQTIMFSPAYELPSSHTPNIARVYNRLVSMLKTDSGMRYMTYVHMMSQDNWRRFRSPEDNGREMMEIFTLDINDSRVTLAGQALQNWRLDRESDTLVVGLNHNRQPINLFNTTVYSGEDFYRELVKSSAFSKGVTTRIVDFFFTQSSGDKKAQITNSILSSNPETWQDILLQIVFSEEYLLHTTRAKSAEELFFSLSKKIEFMHRTRTFHELKDALEDMHQASMRYKLGKRVRVPLDTLSFANYHKYFRGRILRRQSDPSKINDFTSWNRQGWSAAFVSTSKFDVFEDDVLATLDSFIQYLFQSLIARNATAEELAFFNSHMLVKDGDIYRFHHAFDIFRTSSDAQTQETRRAERRRNIAILVLDYISRLSELYTLEKVQ